MLKYLLFIYFITAHQSVYADYTEACFEDAKIAAHANRQVDFLKIPTDKVLLVGGCLKIETSTARLALYQKYLRKKFTVSFNDLSTSSPGASCEIFLRKVKYVTKTQNELSNQNIKSKNLKERVTSTTKMIL